MQGVLSPSLPARDAPALRYSRRSEAPPSGPAARWAACPQRVALRSEACLRIVREDTRGDFTQCPDGGQIIASTPPGAAAPSLGQQPHNFTPQRNVPGSHEHLARADAKGQVYSPLDQRGGGKGASYPQLSPDRRQSSDPPLSLRRRRIFAHIYRPAALVRLTWNRSRLR